MPRRTTPFIPGHYYHLYNRGVNRQTVFFDRDNSLHFPLLLPASLQKEFSGF